MSQQHALIVEDDVILAKIFSHTLKDINYDALIAKNGQIAVELLDERPPDVLILDLHIPYISGEEILKKIRAEDHLSHIKVLIVTADAMKARELQAQNETVLVKPASIVKLQQLVKSL